MEGPDCQARPELSGKARAVKSSLLLQEFSPSTRVRSEFEDEAPSSKTKLRFKLIFGWYFNDFGSTWDRYGIKLGSIRGHFALVRYQFRPMSTDFILFEIWADPRSGCISPMSSSDRFRCFFGNNPLNQFRAMRWVGRTYTKFLKTNTDNIHIYT